MNHKRAVFKCDISGNILAGYIDTKTAANETGISAASITNCLRGRQKSAGGFTWKYDNRGLTIGPELDDPFINATDDEDEW